MPSFSMRKRVPFAAALTVLMAVGGGAPSTALTSEEVARLAGPDRQKIIEDGARKEGEVLWYTSLIVDQVIRPVVESFEKRYPGVALKFVRADTAEILQRVMAEGRARSIRVDVIAVDGAEALEKAGLTQPFESPIMAAYPTHYIDKDKNWVSIRTSWQGIAWNTKLVSDVEAPRTWEALLDPKWKGKMAWGANTGAGAPRLITHLRKVWGEEKTKEYLLKLKAQDVRTLPGSIRTVLDQVIAGEKPLGLSMAMHHIAISKSSGAPIEGTSPEPVMARSGLINFVKGAPHPHAGMLLIDFMMAADGGQRVLRDAQYNPAHPGVPPLPELAWIQPNLNGKEELMMPPDEEAEMSQSSNDLYKEIFR